MINEVVDRHRVSGEPQRHVECCPEIPELRRLQYFYGQLLSGADLQDEQRYFREKLKLLNRCVHGYGVVCGLRVVPAPHEVPCEPEEDRRREELERKLHQSEAEADALADRLASAEAGDRAALEQLLAKTKVEIEALSRELDELCPPDRRPRRSARVTIECGVAIDCAGHEIVVRRPHTIDVFDYLNGHDRRRLLEDWHRPVWVSICFCESPVEPVRPIYSDPCQPADACRYAKIQDSYRIQVSLEPPDRDERCEACCCPCGDPCLVLARIDRTPPHRPIPEPAVHNEVRRRFGLYDWVTVTGISWVHNGHYTDEQAAVLLGRNSHGPGLEFRFSRGVLAETLVPGVIDVWIVEGGRGRAGEIYNVPGTIRVPQGPVVDRVAFHEDSDDKFHDGDRVLIRLRGDFVLDECCQPLDGNHVGGRVPLIPGWHRIEHPPVPAHRCAEPPHGYGPWTSGNRTAGGLFESWFTIRERDYQHNDPGQDPGQRWPRGGARGEPRGGYREGRGAGPEGDHYREREGDRS